MTSIDFTIAIPTYNGANRLPQLLDQLQAQTNIKSLNWEIIIVDNNSSDHTERVIQEYQSNWISPCALKYFFEAQQGSAFARNRAVQEAKGELIGFLDDDIIPSLDWVFQAYQFAQEHPHAGAYGGQIHGDFEGEIPPNFDRIKSFLAIRERGEKSHLYEPKNLILPPSAALVVRKQAWLNHVPKNSQLIGRTKEANINGEDYESLLHIHRGGWEIWYSAMMHVHHKIPHWRLEREYLISLSRSCGLCIFYLRTIGIESWQKPIIFLKVILGSFRRAFWLWVKERKKLKTDIVTACQMEFFLSTCLSPFYHPKLRNLLRQ